MNTFLFGNAKNKAMVIARIAVMAALTVLAQYLAGLAGQFMGPIGKQLLVGSFVNMFLLLSTLITGLIGGITIGLITPFIALWLGLNPQLVLVPFIAVSNAALVVMFALINKWLGLTNQKNEGKRLAILIISVVVAALVKFLLLFFFSRVIFPLFLPADKVKALATAFGFMQLFTALIGGGAAIALYYPLRKAKLIQHTEN